MKWYLRAGFVVVGALALAGAAAVAAVAAVAAGAVGSDQVAEYAARVREFGVQIGLAGAGGFAGVLIRYGGQAWMEYRRTQLAQLIERAVAAQMEAATAPGK